MKKKIGYIIFFLVIVLITLGYSCFFVSIEGDTIWNYGFSYNISRGLVIYRDFNCLQTPLYFFLGSIFIKIFGSYVFSFYILYSVIIALIMVILFRLLGFKSFFFYPMLIFKVVSSYNYLCLLFLFIILYLLHSKKNFDILIGLIVGLIFLTKQSLGILLIPCLYYSRNKIKCLAAFILPILICFIYLIYNGAFYQFIDYCFLGLFDFHEHNTSFSFLTFIEVGLLFYLVVMLVKSKFREQEVFYILLFQVMCYPIFDIFHFNFGLIAILYYVLGKYWNYCFYIYSLLFVIFMFFLFCHVPFVNHEKGYLYMVNDYYNEISKRLREESVVIEKYREKSDYQFYIMLNAYLRKLYLDIPVNQYDLLLDGNMGYHGEERCVFEIEKICSEHSCVFFVEPMDKESQLSETIYQYVISHYKLMESSPYFSIYSN